MVMHWTPELAVGVEEIDAQHRALIERVNHLVDACSAGKCADETAPLLAFLREYVDSHFAAEEDLMERCAFPEREAHRREHREFCQRLDALAAGLATGGEQPQIELEEMIIDWLFDHICIRDRALGKFLGAAR